IAGLLQFLKSIHKPCHLKKFAGQTLGVDAYGWLHRGTVSCAVDLALGRPTTKYVEFAMSRVRMLVHFGIKPYLVFDGDYLPSKAGTEHERAARRKEARKAGLDLLNIGKASQAQQELQKAVDVTPEMARMLIEELKKAGIQYVVAPYEADSQLAYLERKGIIDGIISEDSDLLVFGARVLLTKLDQYGECVMIRRDDFTACKEGSLVGWSDVEFRRMAILSGCDYLPNIKSLGLKTAHGLVRRHKTVERIMRALQFDGKFSIPKDYLENFENADRTFLYQWVFCPLEQKLVNCTVVPDTIALEDLPFIGQCVDASIAVGVSKGNLHPHTKEPIIPLARFITPRSGSRTSLSGFIGQENNIQTPDGKKSTTIDSFFKARRIPLAELDPNSFTPSPSQQQLLEQQQNNGAWSASPAPNPRPPLQPRVYRNSLPATFSQPSRRVFSDSAVRHGATSQPAKRMRLCSEVPLGDTPTPAGVGETEERSKFFKSPRRSASTPVKRSPKGGKRTARAEVNLWSDDSIEDAMAELADSSTINTAEPSPRRVKKHMTVFEDGARVLGRNNKDDSQDSNTSRGSGDSGDSQGVGRSSTPATSVGGSQEAQSPKTKDDSHEAVTFDAYLAKEIQGLREKFSYKSKKSVGGRLSSRKLTVHADEQYTENDKCQGSPGTTEEKNEATEEPEIEDSAWQRVAETVVVAGSPATNMSFVSRDIQITKRAKGSEDLMLVPNSEDESSGQSDEEGDQAGLVSPDEQRNRMNLRRFAFEGGSAACLH
ncbi:hypothetical protein NA57DRAFT_42324, partial [Rhizodiscina lignyota]